MKHELIGGQIRYLRQKRGLTQQELAKEVGVSWEMVSRYERGVSSSLAKIEPLAKALNVDPIELLQKSYNPNSLSETTGSRLPFFISPPPALDFKKEATHYYYSAPEWILESDDQAFMIDSTIVSIKTIQLKENGPIYIAPQIKPVDGDMVLYKEGHSLEIDVVNNLTKKSVVLGVVLAQENRYK